MYNVENFCRATRRRYGNDAQVIKAIEELSELTTECARAFNINIDNLESIETELADATIMLETIRQAFGINKVALNKEIQRKIEREIDRWK